MTRRQTATIVFIVLCVVLVAAALSLNISWIIVNGRRIAPLVFGVLTFTLIIAGIIVYTVFLVREMGITEQQDSFLNSVTHELKTPIASIRLYLETLQSREVGDAQRAEFYRIMLSDTDRLQHTVEQVLKAGDARQRHRLLHMSARGHAGARPRLRRDRPAPAPPRRPMRSRCRAPPASTPAIMVNGDVDELRTAVLNLLDNAVKYSTGTPQVTVQVAAPEPDTAWIRVKDAGVGIPRAQLSRIFNRFYRVPGTRLQGQGHRSRPLHRPVDRQAALRTRVRGQRG